MNFPDRYSRQINLRGFGIEAQQKLQDAKVLVVGAGGLGVPVLQYLVGMGVGVVGLVDGDTISEANLNRQILFYPAEVGELKAVIASTKLSQQNPAITITHYPVFLTVDNAINIIQQYDLVIDATDNFSARYLINDSCVLLNKPFIYGALQQYEGHVSVFNYQGGPTYRCLYPNFPSADEIPDCNTAGVLGVVPGIIGTYQALEAIKVLTGIGRIASGYLRIFDLLNNDSYEVKLKAKQANKDITQLKESYEAPNCLTVPELKPAQLYEWIASDKDFLLLDVREQLEFDQGHLISAMHRPLSNFNVDGLSSLLKDPVVTTCQKGGRSIKAASILRQYNSNLEVYSLEGGLDEWRKEMGNKLIVT